MTVHAGAAAVTPAQYVEAAAALGPDIWVALSDDIPSDSRSDRIAKVCVGWVGGSCVLSVIVIDIWQRAVVLLEARTAHSTAAPCTQYLPVHLGIARPPGSLPAAAPIAPHNCEIPPPPPPPPLQAVDRTTSWLSACLAAAAATPGLARAAAFSAVQGGNYINERIRCAEVGGAGWLGMGGASKREGAGRR